MPSPFIHILILCLLLLSTLVSASLGEASASDLAALNQTVGGLLIRGSPLSRPCFPRFNDHPNAVDQSACSTVQDNYEAPGFRSQSFGAHMEPQWESCQTLHEQCFLDFSNPLNPLAYENSTCFEGSVPPYYITVGNASHVQAAFDFARRTGTKLSIKNSGHDYKGRASGRNTLGLWMHNLSSLSYDAQFVPEGCDTNASFSAVSIEAGTSWKDAYAFAEEYNVTLVGAYHQTVGAAGGWLMGGGHSVLSPVYGLGVDRVLQTKVVTPDGEIRIANECQNSDLFWALRGGGGSTFGVLLEATYKAEKQLRLQVASLAFNSTSENLPGFYSTLVNNTLRWANEGWGGHVEEAAMIYVNPLLSLSEAQSTMKPMTDWIASQNGTVTVETLPSWYTFFEKYVLLAEAGTGSPLVSTTRLMPKSLFETDEGRTTMLDALISSLEFGLPYIPVTMPALYNATEGTTSVTPAWRDTIWSFGVHGSWQYNSSIAEIKAQYAAVHGFSETLRRIAPDSGAYFNEGDVYETVHETSYWGPNYPRLLQIKKKYDPDHILDCWQCVGWNGPQDERYQCYLPESSLFD